MTSFLASIKDIDEATIASTIDIDILDLKNINDGALGFVGMELISKVKNLLPDNILSVTMGNDINPNNDINIRNLKMVVEEEVNYLKIGLFDKKYLLEHQIILKKINFKKTRPICVMFADQGFDLNNIEKLIDIGYQGIMIDTCYKNSKSIVDLLSQKEIKDFLKRVKSRGMVCGLSGSLKLEHISMLRELKPDFLGFRGQLCDSLKARHKFNANLAKKVSKKIKLGS
jgi:(5-formylfuran-3-yl)methyl phosphate synthase|tara:strand:+ start:3134 stop:3817 length:684 start_codon:yes stop_codon:yes gene_type:complete